MNPVECADAVRLPADQAATLAALDGSRLAERLLGAEIRTALSAVRHHEVETYAGAEVAALAERFRATWSG